ncbi:hypothetical protein J7M00_01160 [bacterium]|nr:hypothetical protein [bacterium]
MNKSSNYIVFFLIFVLFIFIIAMNSALFSIGNKLPQFTLPIWAKILLEIILYAGVLYLFYSERRVNIDIWLRAFLIFIGVRILLGLGSAVAFMFVPSPEKVAFNEAFQSALYGKSIIFLLQIIITPFLSYPIVFTYLQMQSEKMLEEEFSPIWEDEKQYIFQIPPEQLNPQVIPPRLWRQFFKDESLSDVKTLLRGIRFSDTVREQIAPSPREADDITKLLKDIIPESPVATATQTETTEVAEELPVGAETPPPEKIEPSPPSPQPPQPQIPQATELSELEELLGAAEAVAEEKAAQQAPPIPPVEEAKPEVEAQMKEKPPAEIPTISPEAIDVVEQAPQTITPEGELNLETPEIEPIPLEMPESLASEEKGEAELISPESIPMEETQPQEAAATPAPSKPPEGGYTITSPDDFFRISLRKLIEINSEKQSAQILERLIKRGANFELSIPMQLLIPQLKKGNAEITVEYVYSEIPIELVNFMSSDQSGDLSELKLSLPLQEIMSATDPKVIFGDTGPQEESKWAQESENIDIDKVFGDLADSVPEGGDEPIVEEEGETLDVSAAAENLAKTEEPQKQEETPEQKQSGFPKPLLDFASANGFTPIMEQSEKMNTIILQPVGVAGAVIAPVAEWAATKSLSEQWRTPPCYIFIETDMISAGILIDTGMRTKRDALAIISTPQDIPSLKKLISEAQETLKDNLGDEEFELDLQEPLPFVVEREIKDVEGYFGSFCKLPGKDIYFLSAVSDDHEHWSEVAGAGNALAQLLAGAGKMFTNWQRAVVHTEGWTLAVLPVKGGQMIIEFKEDIPVQEVPQEIAKLMETLFNV